jgi:hypothetical protein
MFLPFSDCPHYCLWDLDCKFHAIDLEASTETKVLKNVVNKKPRKNSTEIISV